MGRGLLAAAVMGAGLLPASPVMAASLSWPDTPDARARLMMSVQELEITLLTHPSATLALEDWCAAHHMAARPVVVARKAALPQPDRVPARVRADLGVGATQPVRHRQVQLVCGPYVLSVADNWYVPGLLTPRMNATLEGTDTSFGHVVAPLRFTRERLEFARLWSPWPGPAAGQATAMIVAPAEIVRQRAVLRDGQGRAFSEVVETYTDQTLAFMLQGQSGPNP
ncbi:hypothetical protein B0W47_12660 [Komagataeibacter nataicola]|uniref:Chorismate lyase n=1 Tax=Komagataeibacter nataicola TaxID=265960 RepID=A0A9N7H1X4_9PROT|nr:hypothetical protein [Komagataeibacter nataicola]AQU88172.1 hypothetical protein B0W47_12660 [Komagataeibacter nataicola]PYD66024.1 hypothetical protein CDI09_10505 [Komagataeibacter nataicola]WEQ54728.1 hypothetical protein LV564_11150 [Komagataeibacter nataicola]WNM09084.1 hypothetical protein RI056_03250 [Komagataeibacter nataicola]GBR20158.1 hypothetical protein AA0616_1722 [Komagataeibacter nataicola NRIC 0616]